MNSDIQRLNYCAHAIEQLTAELPRLPKTSPGVATVYRKVVRHLKNAQKFLLPDRGEFLDPHTIGDAHLSLLKLPFPVTALEVPFESNSHVDRIGDIEMMPSRKRIALCLDHVNWDLTPPVQSADGNVTPGIYVVPVYFSSQTLKWTVTFGGLFIPDDRTLPEVEYPASINARNASIEAGIAKPGTCGFRGEPVIILDDYYERMLAKLGSHERVKESIINDSRDETMFLLQTCAVLNCENTGVESMDASRTLNKKRKRQGRQPFFSYKVLQIDKLHRENDERGGAHHSPRMHLRRGHIRQYQPGKFTWVRPAMINPSATHGVVMKDYSINPDSQ